MQEQLSKIKLAEEKFDQLRCLIEALDKIVEEESITMKINIFSDVSDLNRLMYEVQDISNKFEKIGQSRDDLYNIYFDHYNSNGIAIQ